MKLNASSRKKLMATTFALFIMVVLIISFSQIAFAQGGVGVDNTPPSFTEISIEEVEEVIYITVGVLDLNGFNEIYAINVTVFDEVGGIISQVVFTQYASLNSTTYFPRFTQNEGSHLNSDYSTSAPVPIAPWNPAVEREIGLNVVFAYDKFAGDSLTIVCTDMGEIPLTSEHTGPFSAEFTPPPAFGDNVAIPISLSSAIAAGGAIFMTYRRLKNNQLARAVENSERGN